MEVFHSEKDRGNVKKVCSLCHGTDLVEGVFRTTGLNFFQPKKTKFWTLKVSNVDTAAYMCRSCGAVSLFGNVKQLEDLMARNTPATPETEKESQDKEEPAP
jgi:hypothetical protein